MFLCASLVVSTLKLLSLRTNNLALHHLPGKRDNFVYICLIALAPLINLWISGYIFSYSSRARFSHPELFALHWIFGLSEFVVGSIGILIFINLAINFFRHRRHLRKTLALLGVLATLDLFLNIVTLIYGIFHFKIASYFLLLISTGIYISLNLIFLFWYWFVDYPTQIRRLHHSEVNSEILFPGQVLVNSSHWIPKPIDYLYFTVLTSNTLGPPDNHSPNGARVKFLQLAHSSLMLVLLVIFVSRAVNTLA